jgi:hypothetical protein
MPRGGLGSKRELFFWKRIEGIVIRKLWRTKKEFPRKAAAFASLMNGTDNSMSLAF